MNAGRSRIQRRLIVSAAAVISLSGGGPGAAAAAAATLSPAATARSFAIDYESFTWHAPTVNIAAAERLATGATAAQLARLQNRSGAELRADVLLEIVAMFTPRSVRITSSTATRVTVVVLGRGSGSIEATLGVRSPRRRIRPVALSLTLELVRVAGQWRVASGVTRGGGHTGFLGSPPT
jgi:hypothetical protein